MAKKYSDELKNEKERWEKEISELYAKLENVRKIYGESLFYSIKIPYKLYQIWSPKYDIYRRIRKDAWHRIRRRRYWGANVPGRVPLLIFQFCFKFNF